MTISASLARSKICHEPEHMVLDCSLGPSASAYVIYYKTEDALRAIQAVINIYVC
jgi:hypothetical protein